MAESDIQCLYGKEFLPFYVAGHFILHDKEFVRVEINGLQECLGNKITKLGKLTLRNWDVDKIVTEFKQTCWFSLVIHIEDNIFLCRRRGQLQLFLTRSGVFCLRRSAFVRKQKKLKSV